MCLCIYTLFLVIWWKKRKNVREMYSNREKITIVLTCTVNPHNNIRTLKMKDPTQRKNIYIDAIRRWLNETSFVIIVVENSGYRFPELDHERQLFHHRFEILSFTESERNEYDLIQSNTSKGVHEFIAMWHAIEQSRFRDETLFWIKITGRYFIPEFENFLQTQDVQTSLALRQSNKERCEIVGAHYSIASYVFFPFEKKSRVETIYKKRISQLPTKNTIICPVFHIYPTLSGGHKKYIHSL